MVNIVPVSRDRHAGKGWRRLTGYSFAATETIVPLTGGEFVNAAVAMPIAFIENSGRYVPVAVMSPVSGRNMFVAPAGQWLGTYVPARLRSYPFLLLRGEGSDQMLLCVDEDSGLVVDADAETEPFFAEDGSTSSAIKPILEFLQQVEHNRLATELAVAGLADAGVIQPWALTIPAGDKQFEVKGLHRVDPARFAALEDEPYLKLRKSSAIELAYTQMLSMQMVRIFLQLAAIQKQMAPPRQSPPIGFRAGRHHPIQLKRPPSPTSRWGEVLHALLGFRRRPGLTVIILAVFFVSLRLGLGFRSIQTCQQARTGKVQKGFVPYSGKSSAGFCCVLNACRDSPAPLNLSSA